MAWARVLGGLPFLVTLGFASFLVFLARDRSNNERIRVITQYFVVAVLAWMLGVLIHSGASPYSWLAAGSLLAVASAALLRRVNYRAALNVAVVVIYWFYYTAVWGISPAHSDFLSFLSLVYTPAVAFLMYDVIVRGRFVAPSMDARTMTKYFILYLALVFSIMGANTVTAILLIILLMVDEEMVAGIGQ